MKDPLKEELKVAKLLLRSYEDLAAEQQEDDAYMARGNGFSNRKYSNEFIEMRIAQLSARVAELKRKIE